MRAAYYNPNSLLFFDSAVLDSTSTVTNHRWQPKLRPTSFRPNPPTHSHQTPGNLMSCMHQERKLRVVYCGGVKAKPKGR